MLLYTNMITATGIAAQGSPIERTRKPIQAIFNELGETHTRRAYRMDQDAFWRLVKLLDPHIKLEVDTQEGSRKRKRRGATNGFISNAARVSLTIRYFAGGSPYDLMITHGVSHSEVYNSIWKVVDAVNSCPELAITFPTCHAKQRELASGFYSVSAAGFDSVVAAVDRMECLFGLIDPLRPSATLRNVAH